MPNLKKQFDALVTLNILNERVTRSEVTIECLRCERDLHTRSRRDSRFVTISDRNAAVEHVRTEHARTVAAINALGTAAGQFFASAQSADAPQSSDSLSEVPRDGAPDV